MTQSARLPSRVGIPSAFDIITVAPPHTLGSQYKHLHCCVTVAIANKFSSDTDSGNRASVKDKDMAADYNQELGLSGHLEPNIGRYLTPGSV